MSTSGLKILKIEHLRGSVVPFSLPFETNKKLTVVYGENGCGKSTICDALEFLGKGRVGSLENRGLGRPNRYWPSLGKKAADIAVQLEASDGASFRAAMVKSEVVVTPASPRPRIEVLRRTQILALIEAQPGDRYAAISRFIDVSGVEASENNLRELIRSLRSSRDIAVARVSENQEAIRQFWEAAEKPGTSALAWAETELKRDFASFDSESSAISNLRSAYAKLTDYPARMKTAQESKQKAADTAVAAQKKVQVIVQSVAADAAETVGVLEAAKSYLQKHQMLVACPLCESAEKVQNLGKRVADRLAVFSALRTAQSEASAAGSALQRAEQQLEVLSQSFRRHIQEFDVARGTKAWPPDVVLPSSAVPLDLAGFEAWLAASAALPADWKNAESARQDRKQFISTLKRANKTYTENFNAQKELDVLLPRLDRALEIAQEERKTFTDTILAKIAAEVGRIYEIVHPGEGLNKISLELDSNRRASLEIAASFCGASGTPPQAYFSDSHLDTLGLCVFLALASQDGPERTILVLDDILASVDEPHVERLIEMLYAEALKFRHCLVTTHYRPWKQKLRWGWLKHGQCHFIELAKWTDTKGLTLIRSIPDVDRLRVLLTETAPDPQLVCAKAAVILEAVLDFLTQIYECSVPRRPGAVYTLGDLLPSINKKLRQALAVEVGVKDAAGKVTYTTVSLTPLLDELTRIAQVRNVFGCHFNTLSFELLDADAIGFGRIVLKLIETLADEDNGWPKSDKSGKYFANSGETRRLHPLQQPN
jgi:hypothetical protein